MENAEYYETNHKLNGSEYKYKFDLLMIILQYITVCNKVQKYYLKK